MTRQWDIDPGDMCDEHLQREHWELHQLVDVIRGAWDIPDSTAVRKVLGHAVRGQVDLSTLQDRHDELAAALDRRGIGHDSPLDFEAPFLAGRITERVRRQNRRELRRRCGKCAHRGVVGWGSPT